MINYREDNKWTVYVHISPSKKCYVGITSQKPNARWRFGHGYKHNDYFTRAIEKYGWHNFQHEIIAEHLTEIEAKEFEKTLIKNLKSNNSEYGYNLTSGGDGTIGISRYGEDNPFYGKHHTEESRELMRKNHADVFGEKNPFYNKTHSEEIKKKLSENAKNRFKDNKNRYHPVISNERKSEIGKEHSKPIIQYDLDMNLVETYDSLLSLEKIGYRRASIRDVCLGRKDTYKNYIWRYKNEQDAWKNGYIVGTKLDNIYCLDKRFNIIGTYQSYSEASRCTGINRRVISDACKNEEHYGYGYYWLFKDDCKEFTLQSSFLMEGDN